MADYVECPHCLGVGEEFSPETNRAHTCKVCDGEGYVTLNQEQTYLKRLNITVYGKDKEDIY